MLTIENKIQNLLILQVLLFLCSILHQFLIRSEIKKIAVLIFSLLIIHMYAQSVQLTLPVPQKLALKLSVSMKKLEEILKCFGKKCQNKIQIWKRVQLTKRYLNQMKQKLSKHNNIIGGKGNTVKGDQNVIIGNYNNIKGSNNWVFISKFTGKIDGDLLISLWRIQLDKSDYILMNPRLAISFIDQTKNAKMKNRYFEQNKQYCQWEEWAVKYGTFNDILSKYYGFSEFFNTWNHNPRVSSFFNTYLSTNQRPDQNQNLPYITAFTPQYSQNIRKQEESFQPQITQPSFNGEKNLQFLQRQVSSWSRTQPFRPNSYKNEVLSGLNW